MATKTITGKRQIQEVINAAHEENVALGMRFIKKTASCVKPGGACDSLRLRATDKAHFAILGLDAAFVGTADYMGMAPFWNQEYKHCMRPASYRQRQRAHAAMLKAGLPVSGVSDQHLEIIERAIR